MSETSTDILGVLVSEGYGIFTQVTSILDSLTQSSLTPTSTSAFASLSSSVSSDASSATPASSTSTSSTPNTSEPSVAAASTAASPTAAATSSTPSSANAAGGGHSNKMAIILGTVLGALALGLLILAILLCCRRRRRRSRNGSVRHSALLPADDEVNGWRQPQFKEGRSYESSKELTEGGAPLMTEHPAYRNSHENPFVPVPPPPRRSAPNSRAGLTDGNVPGDAPYLMEKGTGRPIGLNESRSRSRSGHGKALAMGAGGAAFGAAALHHHNKKRNSAGDDSPKHTINRKPVPVNTISGGEAWPYAYPPPIHNPEFGGAAGVGTPSRQSLESGRGRPGRDPARANAAFNNEYRNSSGDRHPVAAKTAAALGAGALGGAALAHHRDKNREDSDSSRMSHDATLVAAGRQASDTSSDSNNHRYSDAMARQQPGIHELPSNIPPTPPVREHRNSAFGAAAPPAAVGSYFTPDRQSGSSHSRSRSRSRSHSQSSSRPVSFPENPDDYHYKRESHPPIPSRSPARQSFVPSVGASSDYGDIPVTYNPSSPPYERRSLVGDNGYPHMGVPRRKSTAAYEYDHDDEDLSPPAVPKPLGGSDESRQPSDDSTWRLSMGMPGGWQRAGMEQTPRESMDGWVSPVSPVGTGWEADRKSGGSGMGIGRLRRPMVENHGYESHASNGVGRAL